MRSRFAVGLMLAASVFIAGCAGAGEKVATVDGISITKPAYDAVYKQYEKVFHLMPEAGGGKDNAPNPFVQETLKRLTLNKLILNTLVQKDAAALGVTVTDDDVKKLKDEQLKQIGGPEMLDRLLQQNQLTQTDFENTLREQLLVNKFLEKKAGTSLKPSDKEVVTYYAGHSKEFDLPETIRASHILVKAIEPELRKDLRAKEPKLSEDDLAKAVKAKENELKAKADDIDKQVKADPKKFPELAEKDSDDIISSKRGGDLGPMTEKVLDPVFWSAIKKTKPGEFYPGVLTTQFGYHIIKVTDHVQAHHQSLAEAKPVIVSAMETQKKQQLLEKWVGEKKASIKIAIEPSYQPKDIAPPGGMPGQMGPGGPGGGLPPGGHPPLPPHGLPPAPPATKQ